MSACAAHIYQHDRTITSFEAFGNSFLERKEIEPARTTLTLACHPEVEVVEMLGVFWEPLKHVVFGMKAFLESAFLRVSGILILSLGEEWRKSHGGGPHEIIGMIDACFKLGDDQVLCDAVGGIAIDAGFIDVVRSDKEPKEAEEQYVIGTSILR